MKTSRFTDSQILAVLKEAEVGVTVPELGRTHGISAATFYQWRAKFGGMDVPLMTRLKSWRTRTGASRSCTPRRNSVPISCARRSQ